ncbi:hypothetical protein PSAB6_230020 [Paraburkholderia sabiae]|nr:hypothetical protein PSAB6_230020 [Paraburkholderia sabiae]
MFCFVCDASRSFWVFCFFVFLFFGFLLRWHPRFRIRASNVAPVRGGTYFSLPLQRKVGAAPHRGNA